MMHGQTNIKFAGNYIWPGVTWHHWALHEALWSYRKDKCPLVILIVWALLLAIWYVREFHIWCARLQGVILWVVWIRQCHMNVCLIVSCESTMSIVKYIHGYNWKLCDTVCFIVLYNWNAFYVRWGLGSSVGIGTELRAGRSRDWIPAGRDFPPIQIGPGGPPSLLYIGYRFFLGGKVRPERAADYPPPSCTAVMEE